MKKLLISTLFLGFAISAQAQEIPKECKDLIAYSEKMLEAGKNKSVAVGCAEMLKMFQEMNHTKQSITPSG